MFRRACGVFCVKTSDEEPMEMREAMKRSEAKRGMEFPLKGALTIQRVAALKEELLEALNQVNNLQIILSEATEVDLSCLQLLCSGYRTAVRLNKSLSLIGRLPEGISAALRDAGLPWTGGCQVGCGPGCLWVSGTKSLDEGIPLAEIAMADNTVGQPQ